MLTIWSLTYKWIPKQYSVSRDLNLKLSAHIQNVSNTFFRTLAVMCKLTDFLPLCVLRILYNCPILPHLQYVISFIFHQ